MNKILEQRSSLPNRQSQIPESTTPTETTNQPNQSGSSTETRYLKQHSEPHIVWKILEVFKSTQDKTERTPLEHRLLFTDENVNVSLENIERICQNIRRSQPINHGTATIDKHLAQVINAALDTSTRQPEISTGSRPTTTKNRRLTVDEEDEEDNITIEPTRRREKRRPSNCITQTTNQTEN